MKWFLSVWWREATQILPTIDGINLALIYVILDLGTVKFWSKVTMADTHVRLTIWQVHLDHHNLFGFMFNVSVKHSHLAYLSQFGSITHWNNCELSDGPRRPNIQPIQKEVKVGSSLTMQCETTAEPPPTSYTWYRHTRGASVIQPMTGKALNLRGLKRGDEACYTCSATNTIKTGERSEEACIEVLCKSGCRSLFWELTRDNKFVKSDMVSFHFFMTGIFNGPLLKCRKP